MYGLVFSCGGSSLQEQFWPKLAFLREIGGSASLASLSGLSVAHADTKARPRPSWVKAEGYLLVYLWPIHGPCGHIGHVIGQVGAMLGAACLASFRPFRTHRPCQAKLGYALDKAFNRIPCKDRVSLH